MKKPIQRRFFRCAAVFSLFFAFFLVPAPPRKFSDEHKCLPPDAELLFFLFLFVFVCGTIEKIRFYGGTPHVK